MAKASDNQFPKIVLTEQASTPSNPPAGDQKLFIDSADNKLKRVNSAGAVTIIEGGGAGSDTSAIHDNESGEINALTEKVSPVSADLVVIEDSAASYAKKKAQIGNLPGGGGGISWSQVVNESGTSFTNFTGTGGGTWSSDGTVIKQTNTAATRFRCYHTTKIVTSFAVVEAEIQLKTSGSDNRGGFIIGFDGTSGYGCAVFISENNTVQVEVDGVVNKYNHSVTINVDTWYKLRAVCTGHSVSVYLDGTLIFSSGNNVQGSDSALYIGLLAYQAEVWFRNIKAWNLTLPA